MPAGGALWVVPCGSHISIHLPVTFYYKQKKIDLMDLMKTLQLVQTKSHKNVLNSHPCLIFTTRVVNWQVFIILFLHTGQAAQAVHPLCTMSSCIENVKCPLQLPITQSVIFHKHLLPEQ